MGGFHDLRSYPDAQQLPGLVVVRFDAPLIFANAKAFRAAVMQVAGESPKPRWILVAAEPITDVDTTAADHARGPRRGAEPAAHQPGVRRAEGSGPSQDREVRSDPYDRPDPLLSDRSMRLSRHSVPRPARTGKPRPEAEDYGNGRQRNRDCGRPEGTLAGPVDVLLALALVVVLFVGGSRSIGVFLVALAGLCVLLVAGVVLPEPTWPEPVAWRQPRLSPCRWSLLSCLSPHAWSGRSW